MADPTITAPTKSVWRIFLIFLKLGSTSFGGPIAHLGYFRDEFVLRRQWLGERSYTDLVALCQFLPGPVSSQVGMALGLSRGGYSGALAAWLGFTLPSAVLLILLAQGLSVWGEAVPSGLLHSLKIAAVAVVAQAVWGMARSLCTGTRHISIMVAATCIVLVWPTAIGQLSVMLAAACIGLFVFAPGAVEVHEPLPITVRRRTGSAFLLVFFGLLAGLPLIAQAWPTQAMAMIDVFYRAGSLVFGGGHVILPLLQAQVVPNGWVGNETFLAGYGAAQAVPGPLFTFAAFLGASMDHGLGSWTGGLLCLVAIFVPSFLIVAGALPFWEQLRRSTRMRAALVGMNAAVVGLLLAALYHPVWTSAIHKPVDFGLALLALVALMFWRLPPWLVVVGSGLFAYFLNGFIPS